mmetsp:Transcript_4765/g.12038  ORF Transcript_4765/g.12038 Transcript_4765/m.12038 type:complete len:103 (-) Transcript_4765:372-680(-)
MKGGTCKEAFVAWEKCVDVAKDAESDFVTICQKQTEGLRDCMLADPGYYGEMIGDEGEKKEEDKEDGKEAGKEGDTKVEGGGDEKKAADAGSEPEKTKEAAK